MANVIVLFFSVQSFEMFVWTDKMVDKLRNDLNPQQVETTKFLIVGTRKDLEDTRVVPRTLAEELAKKKNCKYVETGKQVDSLTNVLAEYILEYNAENEMQKNIKIAQTNNIIIKDKKSCLTM
ncbi:hypothetical protein EIN_502100 [Entamoeba invadens IP1]|uniref:Uncharacterized protein n=1 Tax=Entamoeba invadens IP1 TaxID=370355 RepID=A0A0A1TV22_ENTIV|nr:hypothetical protein EIN_502100 [Entamoeba invadens IP1]ELP84097.1 hypothetical protein EIN_502100 [Entamoeba invadens IP1]|eukprot:XP_004183443.1 hypothetical protein EIN_502100 [Entamoeba invadens IP1]